MESPATNPSDEADPGRPVLSLHDLGPRYSASRSIWLKMGAIIFSLVAIAVVWTQINRHVVEKPEPLNAQESSRSGLKTDRQLVARFTEDPDSLSDQRYVQAALAYEASMASERESRQPVMLKQNPIEPSVYWNQQTKELRKFVNSFDQFPPNTIQWHLRNELADGPLESK